MKIKSFFVLNNKFNEQLVSLYEDNKKNNIITKYMKLIKEDKILKKQYDLFNILDEGVESFIFEDKIFLNEYFNEIIKPFENFTKKEINESNEKLFLFLKENNLIDDENLINEDKLTSSVEYIIYEGNKNIGECMIKKFTAINEFKIKKENNIVNEIKTVEEKISEFNEKYENSLTNEEMEIVKSLMTHGENKPKILKEYQKRLINNLNNLIKETTDTELKDKYLQLKEQVLFDDKTVKIFEINKLVNEIKNKE